MVNEFCNLIGHSENQILLKTIIAVTPDPFPLAVLCNGGRGWLA